MIEVDASRRIRWVTPSAQRLLGWTAQALVGFPLSDLLHPDDDLFETLSNQNAPPLVRLRQQHGGHRWMRRRVCRAQSGEGRTATGWILGFQDVEEMVQQRRACAIKCAQLAAMARHTNSVGLKSAASKAPHAVAAVQENNRFHRCRREPQGKTAPMTAAAADVLGSLARWHRQADRTQPLALLLCTLSAAQTLRHPKGTGKGDLLWETITDRLAEVVSPQGFAGDLGEGKFIGVTAGVANLREATILAERVYTSLALPVVVEGSPVATQPCLGIALENPGSTLQGLMLRAQQALEQAIRCNTRHNQAIAIL